MTCGPGLMPMAFDVANPEVIAWAERHAAKMVTDITMEARAAIRAVIVDAFENGIPPRDVARLIRSSIGLTERDVNAVMRQLNKDFANGVNADKAVARAERYADKMLSRRAQTIARTELMKASNEGTQQLWAQARGKGLLDATAMKTWIAYDPCPLCAAVSGEIVPVDMPFSNGSDGPPLHPNCRCTIGLV